MLLQNAIIRNAKEKIIMDNKSMNAAMTVENPLLKELFSRWRSIGDSNSREAQDCMNGILTEVVENAQFLSVVDISSDRGMEFSGDGTAVLQEDTEMSFKTLSDDNGNIYFPAFTDWENLRMWADHREGDVDTLVLKFDDYYTLIKDGAAGIVINPFSDNLPISNELMQHLREVRDHHETGHCDHVVQQEAEVMIGEPADYPKEMVDAIVRYAKTDKHINAIYLKLMINGGERSYLLIVDFKGDINEIFGCIAQAAQPYIPSGMFIDMLPITDDFGRKAADNEPFYRKKKRLFG